MWLYAPFVGSRSAPEEEGLSSGSRPPLPPSAFRTSAFATSSGKPSRRPLSWPGWRTRPWIALLSGMTSRPSALGAGVERWILSLADTPASPFPWPAAGREPTTHGTSGPTQPESSGPSGQLSFFSKTSPTILTSEDLKSAAGFRAWATRLRRHSSARRKSARATGASGCSSWAWQTPRRTEAESGAYQRDHGRPGSERLTLNGQVGAWPTPQAHDVHPGDPARGGRYGTEHGGRNLTDEASLWPTPKTPTGGANTGREERGSGGPDLQESAELWAASKAADGIKPSAGKRASSDLSHQAQATQGGRRSSKPPLGSRRPSRRLNPAFAEWLMGWPAGWSLPCAGALTAFGSSATESSGSPPPGPSVSSGGR